MPSRIFLFRFCIIFLFCVQHPTRLSVIHALRGVFLRDVMHFTNGKYLLYSRDIVFIKVLYLLSNESELLMCRFQSISFKLLLNLRLPSSLILRYNSTLALRVLQ